MPIITTLYDLMAALQAASALGAEDLVPVAVVDLCHTGRLRFLAWPHTPVTIDACMSLHERQPGHERLRNIFSPCERGQAMQVPMLSFG
jgi:hypothetical protein